MGIGRTAKKMFNSGNQTINHTTSLTDSNRPLISEGQLGGVSNFRSQYDKDDNISSAFGSNRQTRYERSNKLESDPGNGKPMISASNAWDKEFVPGSSELGSLGKRSAIEADYDNRGSFGIGLAGATTGTHHQRRTSDLGGTGFGNDIACNSPPNKTVDHRAEHTTKPTENVTNASHQLNSNANEIVNQRENEGSRDNQNVHHVVQRDAQSFTDESVKDDHDMINNIRKAPDEINAEMRGQTQKDIDNREVSESERAIIDKGESISEREIHHVHHIIQPIINKETIEQHRIHTTIPVHQITHEAPIVHKSQTHAPVSMEHFTQRGGRVTDGLTYDQIGSTVLRSGDCTREVDGDGDSIARELTGSGLPGAGGGHFGCHSGDGRPDLDREHISEQGQGVNHPNTCVSSSGPTGARSKETSTSMNMNKRDESASMYGSQGHNMDSHSGYNKIGPNDTGPMVPNMV